METRKQIFTYLNDRPYNFPMKEATPTIYFSQCTAIVSLKLSKHTGESCKTTYAYVGRFLFSRRYSIGISKYLD